MNNSAHDAATILAQSRAHEGGREALDAAAARIYERRMRADLGGLGIASSTIIGRVEFLRMALIEVREEQIKTEAAMVGLQGRSDEGPKFDSTHLDGSLESCCELVRAILVSAKAMNEKLGPYLA